MRLHLDSIGLMAPGLPGWEAAQEVLRSERALEGESAPVFRPTLLPPNERRRTTALIKLALQTAEDALARSRYPMAELASVFVSAEGDGEIVDRICTALTLPERPVSPTHFHNSVHNAPAGYWAIASGSQHFSTSLAAGADSFAAGLLEAAAVAALEQVPVMLLAYDYALPPALAGRGYVDAVFGVALILSADEAPGLAALTLELESGTAPPPPLPPELAALRAHNPAAGALPLLVALASSASTTMTLPCHDGQTLRIGIER